MITVKNDFIQRKKEIEIYFKFLEKLLTNDNISWNETKKEKINVEFKGIAKANIFLMLYNIVESSISAAIEQIHISIKKDKKAKFDNIRQGIKINLIKYLKNKKNYTKFVEETHSISNDIITICFEKKSVFSGNADRDEIVALANTYGFSHDSDYSKTKHGEKLKKIKTNRNDLAHGDFSFYQIGRDYTISDIEDYKNEALAYVEAIILNIETYIKNQHYKKEVV
jgi:hypothetical protein